MAIRKIALMHRLFGTAPGTCGECCHLLEGRYHDKMYRKCEIYGLTHSEASDWAKRWAACGLKNKETLHENVIRTVQNENRKNPEPLSSVLDGQISLESD